MYWKWLGFGGSSILPVRESKPICMPPRGLRTFFDSDACLYTDGPMNLPAPSCSCTSVAIIPVK